MPTGTLTKKIHDQLRALVSDAAEQHAGRGAAAGDGAPDAEREVALAAFVERRHEDRERGRREQRRAEPLSERNAISEPSDHARPSSSELAVNSASPTMNMRRRPSRSASRPPSSSTPPKRIE